MSVLAAPARASGDLLHRLLLLIAVATAVTGLVQLVAPGVVLDLLDAESTATSRQLFATVGMFMLVVGGLTVQALRSLPVPGFVLAWAAAQKAGAAGAVAWGVAVDVFGPVALLVAVFDGVTAVLAIVLWRRVRAA